MDLNACDGLACTAYFVILRSALNPHSFPRYYPGPCFTWQWLIAFSFHEEKRRGNGFLQHILFFCCCFWKNDSTFPWNAWNIINEPWEWVLCGEGYLRFEILSLVKGLCLKLDLWKKNKFCSVQLCNGFDSRMWCYRPSVSVVPKLPVYWPSRLHSHVNACLLLPSFRTLSSWPLNAVKSINNAEYTLLDANDNIAF